MARFTAANAREMAAKAHAARRQRLANGELAGETFPQPPQTAPHGAADDYMARRLARVRTQIERLSAMLDKEKEPQKIDRLTAALERVSKLEFAYANRPMPGTWKPAPQRSQRDSRPSAEPL